MKKAILLVSFGTSVEEARQRQILPLEKAVRQAYEPKAVICSAYTSPTIRGILARRGISIPSPEEALTSLAQSGVTHLLVQPTHLIPGQEYEGLRALCSAWAGRFRQLTLGLPLISSPEDMTALAKILSRAFPTVPGQAVLFAGHGTSHFANAAYPAMETAFRILGREDVFIAAIEGWPTLEDAVRRLQKHECKVVLLAPLMLVAGDHAQNDIAGEDPESWKSVLTARGFQTKCRLSGLGEMPEIHRIYLSHIENADRDAAKGGIS